MLPPGLSRVILAVALALPWSFLLPHQFLLCRLSAARPQQVEVSTLAAPHQAVVHHQPVSAHRSVVVVASVWLEPVVAVLPLPAASHPLVVTTSVHVLVAFLGAPAYVLAPGAHPVL